MGIPSAQSSTAIRTLPNCIPTRTPTASTRAAREPVRACVIESDLWCPEKAGEDRRRQVGHAHPCHETNNRRSPRPRPSGEWPNAPSAVRGSAFAISEAGSPVGSDFEMRHQPGGVHAARSSPRSAPSIVPLPSRSPTPLPSRLPQLARSSPRSTPSTTPSPSRSGASSTRTT